jgi:hypothetical protein
MRNDIAERFSEPKGRYKKSKYPRRHKKVCKTDEDGHPPDIKGMKKVHVAAGDWYHDNGYGSDYSVLRRMLESNKGRKWDDVFSEICKAADDRTHDGWRLREAVTHIVCTNAEIGENGKVYSKDRWGRAQLTGWWTEFYVHPETGNLEVTPNRRNTVKYDWREAHGYTKKTVFEMDGVLYHKHDDLWYRVEMAPLPKEKIHGYDYSTTLGVNDACRTIRYSLASSRWNDIEKLRRKYGLSPGGEAWYCKSKQAANSHEIQKLKKKYELE